VPAYADGFSCVGCYGAYGGYSGYGVPAPSVPPTMAPGTTTPGRPAPEVTPPPAERKKVSEEQVRSKVRVEVPEDAKLYIDGKLMRTASARRIFQTPPLEPNRIYFYDVRVELERNGQTFRDSQRLIIRPGQEVTASFADLERRAAAAATATAQNTEE